MSKEQSNQEENKALHIVGFSESLSEDDLYVEYMLNQMPELTEEENRKQLKELDKCADLIRKKGITPNLDSIY